MLEEWLFSNFGALVVTDGILVGWLGVSDRKGWSMAALRLGDAAEAEGVGEDAYGA
jgi:hypothetical protein